MMRPPGSRTEALGPEHSEALPSEAARVLDLPLPPWLKTIIEEEGRLVLRSGEVARLLGLSRGSVRAAIAENRIYSVRLGRRLLIPLLPLLELLDPDQGLEG